jgi:RND family efflux transporter MFP subunit
MSKRRNEQLSEAGTQTEVNQWLATLAYAQARLAAAEARLDAQVNSYDTEEVAIAQLEVTAAEMAEAQAQQDLGDLVEDIALKELRVEAAADSVAQARESVALAEQSARLARQSLALAQKNLDEAVIIAPFAGVVAGASVEEGDTVTAATIIVHLVDPGSLELIVEIDEMDVPGVRLNQEALISVDALPADTFTGRVAAVYPVPADVSGIVTYNVRIAFEAPEDSVLKVGMNASADIATNKRSGVLLVPDDALKVDDQGNQFVQVVNEKQVEERTVVTGLTDGKETEIISGLSEGETVLK